MCMPTLLSILRDNYKMLKRQLGHPAALTAVARLPIAMIGKKTKKF